LKLYKVAFTPDAVQQPNTRQRAALWDTDSVAHYACQWLMGEC